MGILNNIFNFLAPEIYAKGAISFEVDYYAMGCTIYELMTGKVIIFLI